MVAGIARLATPKANTQNPAPKASQPKAEELHPASDEKDRLTEPAYRRTLGVKLGTLYL